MKSSKIKVSEKDVQATILQWLAARKIFHYRNNSGALQDKTGRPVFFGTVGSPDIVAVVRGRYVGIECKGSDGRQSPAQKDFEARLWRAGGVYVLARSVEEVEKTIESIIQ